MPSTLGNTTQTIFFKGFTEDGLYEEFTTSADVKQGQFVKLGATGLILPAAAGDGQSLIIGVALQDAASGKNCTVNMRGIGTLIVEGTASMASGPVKFSAFTSGTGLNRVVAAVEASAGFVAATSGGSPTVALATAMDKCMIGWALENAVADGDQIRMVVRM
jgi:predicted RecA/RadA family phage recombinase